MLSEQLSTDLTCPLQTLNQTLTVLELSGFAISQFPVWLLQKKKSLLGGSSDVVVIWPVLTELNLSLNNFSTSLPTVEINPFPSLSNFSLHSCSLIAAPPIGYFIKDPSSNSSATTTSTAALPLEEIYLGKNQLSDISPVLMYSSCSKMYLARNRLQVLPSPIQVTHFTLLELWLGRNELKSLPKDFSSCLGGCLIKLDLSGNRFSCWENSSDSDNSLETSLGNGIKGLNQLKRLDVSGNNLNDQFPSGLFDDGLQHLQELLAAGCLFALTDEGRDRKSVV